MNQRNRLSSQAEAGSVAAPPTGQEDGYFEGPPLEAGHEHAKDPEPRYDSPLLEAAAIPTYNTIVYDDGLLKIVHVGKITPTTITY